MKTILTLGVLAMCGTLALKAADEKPKRDPEEMFKKLDTNNDGSLSKEEYLAGPAAKKDSAAAEERFKKLDKDSDSKLSKDEFKAGMSGKKKAK